MPSSEDIEAQKELLNINRKNVRLYLKQRDRLGYAHITPAIAHGLNEARLNIYRSKSILRTWNIEVEDIPSDEEEPTDITTQKPDITTSLKLTCRGSRHREHCL